RGESHDFLPSHATVHTGPYTGGSVDYAGCGLQRKRSRVHRAAALLHASFRPRLAATPLRFANPSPPSGWIEDFHLQAVDHARHTNETGARRRRRRRRGELCGSAVAAVEHRDGTAVLRPAGDIVAHRDRPLLAVRDGAHAVAVDAARREIFAHGLSTAGAQRDVVLAGAA